MMLVETLGRKYVKQVVSFTRNNKMTATDLKEIASQVIGICGVSLPEFNRPPASRLLFS